MKTSAAGPGDFWEPHLGVAIVTAWALACVIYAFVLSSGHPITGDAALIRHLDGGLNLVFNSMAEHLLDGRFDVDPAIVGAEGFLVDGRVVAYWGIPFAVMRLPLVVFRGGLGVDITALSCLVAVCIAAYAKLQSLALVFRQARVPCSGVIFWLLALTILFSGPQIEFLKSSVYQEVCLWAGALGALFVYRLLSGVLRDDFSPALLCGLASIAGVAVLSRVSTGIGLYAACGVLLLSRSIAGRGNVLLPLSILGVFAAATGVVNYERWGNPLVFADYHLYLENATHPDRLERLATYGMFNGNRIPLSLLYYFLPLWIVRRDDGTGFFDDLQNRLYDFIELPPSTFILTDALLVGFLIYAVRRTFPLGSADLGKRLTAVAVAGGLSLAGALMLTVGSLSYRYRIEFYPALEFAAFIGVYSFLRGPSPARAHKGYVTYLIGAGAAVGIFASCASLVLYKLSGFGSGTLLIRSGFWAHYTDSWQGHVSRFFH